MSKQDELELYEPHPASLSAMDYIKNMPIGSLMKYNEAFASCAIEGNRLGEICCSTIDRLLDKKPVSDRYLLGLAWAIKEIEDERKEEVGGI